MGLGDNMLYKATYIKKNGKLPFGVEVQFLSDRYKSEYFLFNGKLYLETIKTLKRANFRAILKNFKHLETYKTKNKANFKDSGSKFKLEGRDFRREARFKPCF